MKTLFLRHYLIFLLFSGFGQVLFGLNSAQAQVISGPVEVAISMADVTQNCISDADADYNNQMVKDNMSLLQQQNKLISRSIEQISFDWPLKQSAGFEYKSTWAISNYIDRDPSSGLQDWNCQERTYNGHSGTDIFLWPFWWKQMDDDQTEIIAAAEGQIIYKKDGYFDRSCTMNDNPWNAVYILHADGSVAWYGHMKNGSATGKGVGDTVARGEYLGLIGSSGSSTGPHLHFEVHDANNNLIDPYNGNCNDNSSWWTDQRPYNNPAINAVLTHTAPPDFGTCPDTEITYESNQFSPFDAVYLAAYYRDQQPGTSAANTILDPSGNAIYNWTTAMTDFYSSSYWYYILDLNEVEGTWTYRVEYMGQTVDHTFNVGELSVSDFELNTLKLYPNPGQHIINIDNPQNLKIDNIIVYNTLGQKVNSFSNPSEGLDISALAKGMYYLKLQMDDRVQILNFIKE